MCNVLVSKKAIKYDHSVLGIEILMILQEAGQLKSQRINNSDLGGSLFILISASMHVHTCIGKSYFTVLAFH